MFAKYRPYEEFQDNLIETMNYFLFTVTTIAFLCLGMAEDLGITEKFKYEIIGWTIIGVLTFQLVFNFAFVIIQLVLKIKEYIEFVIKKIKQIRNKIKGVVTESTISEEGSNSMLVSAIKREPKLEDMLKCKEIDSLIGTKDKNPSKLNLYIDKNLKENLMSKRGRKKKKVKKVRHKDKQDEILMKSLLNIDDIGKPNNKIVINSMEKTLITRKASDDLIDLNLIGDMQDYSDYNITKVVNIGNKLYAKTNAPILEIQSVHMSNNPNLKDDSELTFDLNQDYSGNKNIDHKKMAIVRQNRKLNLTDSLPPQMPKNTLKENNLSKSTIPDRLSQSNIDDKIKGSKSQKSNSQSSIANNNNSSDNGLSITNGSDISETRINKNQTMDIARLARAKRYLIKMRIKEKDNTGLMDQDIEFLSNMIVDIKNDRGTFDLDNIYLESIDCDINLKRLALGVSNISKQENIDIMAPDTQQTAILNQDNVEISPYAQQIAPVSDNLINCLPPFNRRNNQTLQQGDKRSQSQKPAKKKVQFAGDSSCTETKKPSSSTD